MVIFDRLQVSYDGKMLYIDVHVNKADYFKNIVLDKIIVQTSDQVSEADPLSPGNDCIYSMTIEEDTTEQHLALNAMTDFDKVYSTLSDKLLFVYVVCRGIVDPCTPCGMDELTTLRVTFDTSLLYQNVMQLTRELNDECRIPKRLIDLILLWNGFKAAIETGHYIPAIDFWKRMFSDEHSLSSVTLSKGCGCHG